MVLIRCSFMEASIRYFLVYSFPEKKSSMSKQKNLIQSIKLYHYTNIIKSRTQFKFSQQNRYMAFQYWF